MVGALAEITGQRPSSFFNWNDEDEWQERLIFDMHVVGLLKKEEKKQQEQAMKNAKKRR